MHDDTGPPPLLTRLGGDVRLALVSDDPADHRAWLDRELASMCEGYLGIRLDPRDLDWLRRRPAIQRLGKLWGGDGEDTDPRESFGTRYWITRVGERVGTIAVQPAFGAFLPLASLYVDPGARGAGIAGEALAIAQEAAVLAGRDGISLETHWTWGPAVRLYLRLGFQVRHWKRSLYLVRAPELGRLELEIAGETARLLGEGRTLITARREGDRLGWEESPELPVAAVPTFALMLAARGFPLIRSIEAWRRSREEFDVGGPEALARRIVIWEALARRDGHAVDAPRIPGITYRTWDELRRPATTEELLRRIRAGLSGFTVLRDRPAGCPVDLVSRGGEPELAIAVVGHDRIDDRALPASVQETAMFVADTPFVELRRRVGDGTWRMDFRRSGTVPLAGAEIDLDALYAGLDLDPL
jgi:ribosomal protein S18 acetylase RimI-like enzyme